MQPGNPAEPDQQQSLMQQSLTIEGAVGLMISRFSASARMLVALMLLAAVSACASSGGEKSYKAGDYAALYKQAEAEVTAGRVDAALIGFNDAAKADPTRKEPWVRAAQLQFDKGNYARAILAAEEVLQRDPKDLVADSVLAVGGFRIANQSLQRLRGNGALASDTARREAEQLVRTLRDTMGEDVMTAGRPAPKRVSSSRRSSKTASRRSSPPPTVIAAPAPVTSPAPEPEVKKQEAPASDPFKNIGGN